MLSQSRVWRIDHLVGQLQEYSEQMRRPFGKLQKAFGLIYLGLDLGVRIYFFTFTG